MQPSSLHFRMESHAVENHEAGSVPSGKIFECKETHCLDAGQCACLFHAMALNTVSILVKF